ncbi:MAG: GerMN domain-containing protein, partial [Deltaproteobacteria bacterium]|nr:GerMN domain-containing protein [Deltaproteobacteria bacterium]
SRETSFLSLYFVSDESYVRITRLVPRTQGVARATVEQLLQGPGTYADVLAQPIGAGSALNTIWFAADDEIQEDSENLLGFRIVQRGNNIAVRVRHRKHSTNAIEVLRPVVERIGGYIDGGHDLEGIGLIVLTFPVTTGFDSIERNIDWLVRHNRDFIDWQYGNRPPEPL